MSQSLSPSGGKAYGVARVVKIWNLARSSFYAARDRERNPRQPRKRGPKVLSDVELLAAIRQLLDEAVFAGEGYRKIWARLRYEGIRTSKERVNRLLRENQLLSPQRQSAPAPELPHEGTIVTNRPNEMWGTDATATATAAEGTITVFAAIDHCTAECVGIHAVKKATRFEALEPVRQAVRERLGGFRGGVATGLRLRHDHGSVYMSDDFQNEIRFLGIESSPAFVRQPEATAVSSVSSERSKSSCSGSGGSAISTSFPPLSSSSATAITSNGSSGVWATEHQLRRAMTSKLHYQQQRDSMSQLTPSLLSNRSGPNTATSE